MGERERDWGGGLVSVARMLMMIIIEVVTERGFNFIFCPS